MTPHDAQCVRCGATGALGAPCSEHPELRLADPESIRRYPEAHLLGRYIAGRYAVVRVIGVGGMGWVYEARQEPIGRKVAIKVLKLDRAEDPTLRERFLREAQILGMLKHPNLVGLHDFGEVDKPEQLFMALEFVEGTQLGAVMKRLEPMSAQRLVRILEGIAAGLAEIHHHDVVHRDIKPENIILVPDHEGQETARLLDFGIARFDPHRAHLTQTGMTFGTPEYMSPEQAKGLDTIGPGTDIYAVGVLMYQLLSGRLPFSNKSMLKVMLAQVHKAPPPLTVRSEVVATESLVALMQRCLEKEPEKRPEDGDALLRELRHVRTLVEKGDATLIEGDDARFSPERGNTNLTVPTIPLAPATPMGLDITEDFALAVDPEPTIGQLPSNVDEHTVGGLPSAHLEDDAVPVDDDPTLAGTATLQLNAMPANHAPPEPEPEPEPTFVDALAETTDLDLKNDLDASVYALDTSDLREERSANTVLTIVVVIAIAAAVVGLLAFFSGEEEATGSEEGGQRAAAETSASATQAPATVRATAPAEVDVTPETSQAPAHRVPPAGVVTKLARLNALHVALGNDASVPPAAREERAQEIQGDIDALLEELSAAGFPAERVGERYQLVAPEAH